jgi:hypothetical protein
MKRFIVELPSADKQRIERVAGATQFYHFARRPEMLCFPPANGREIKK